MIIVRHVQPGGSIASGHVERRFAQPSKHSESTHSRHAPPTQSQVMATLPRPGNAVLREQRSPPWHGAPGFVTVPPSGHSGSPPPEPPPPLLDPLSPPSPPPRPPSDPPSPPAVAPLLPPASAPPSVPAEEPPCPAPDVPLAPPVCAPLAPPVDPDTPPFVAPLTAAEPPIPPVLLPPPPSFSVSLLPHAMIEIQTTAATARCEKRSTIRPVSATKQVIELYRVLAPGVDTANLYTRAHGVYEGTTHERRWYEERNLTSPQPKSSDLVIK